MTNEQPMKLSGCEAEFDLNYFCKGVQRATRGSFDFSSCDDENPPEIPTESNVMVEFTVLFDLFEEGEREFGRQSLTIYLTRKQARHAAYSLLIHAEEISED